MKSPRCSLPDQDQASLSASSPESGNTRRRRRAAAMWTRRNINWRFDLHTQYNSSVKKKKTFNDADDVTHAHSHGLKLNLISAVTSVSMARLRSYPSSSRLSREMIRSLVFYALRVWSEPTPLDFHEVGTFDPCCIYDARLGFVRSGTEKLTTLRFLLSNQLWWWERRLVSVVNLPQ